jgi:predicted phosphodiesterase
MKRILLISDTHGHLDLVDGLAARERADAVIHAGDFGFYDDESVDRLEARELFLRVVHSDLPPEEKSRAKKLSGDKMRSFIRGTLPLSDLGRWLREGRGFEVPTFAVWGNHEDRVVVENLLAGRARVPNLTLISERASHQVGCLRIFGLGGNVIGGRLDDEVATLAGEGGKIWTTRAQIARLLETAAPRARGEIRVFVSHVSPGREPIVELLASHLGAHVSVSGHMGSPWPVVWSEFGLNDTAAANERLRRAHAALGLPIPPIPEAVDERGAPLPPWYRGLFHVNLPDAPDGHAVLILSDDGRLGIETRAEGLRLAGGG